MPDSQPLLSGTALLWIFYILLFVASYFVGTWLQKEYRQRGK